MSVDGEVIPIDRKAERSAGIVASDPAMRATLKLAENVAKTSSTVLLLGESGVGKEVISRHIHRCSPRASSEMVAINCAALPSSLLESELFGHEKGAFSGAVDRHLGVFERANGSTILLDEISEISADMQVKLLRVLQERKMYRVGGRTEIGLDIRVVATSNRNLREMVDNGEFRLDLFYRLNVFPINIPSLRERRKDIEPLVLKYSAKFADQFGTAVQGITKGAMSRLESYPWPGNIRELVNVAERAAILAMGEEVISEEHLVLDGDVALAAQDETFEAMLEDEELVSFIPGSEPLTDVRRKIILGTLERFDGNRTRTAEALGVSLRTIRNKIRDYRDSGIDVPDN